MHTRAKLATGLIVFLVGLPLGACTGLPSGQGSEPPPTISVTGTGIASSAPDIAVMQVGVQSQGENLPSLIAENLSKINAIRSALEESGVEEKDVQSSNLTVSAQPIYNYDIQLTPTAPGLPTPAPTVTTYFYVVDNTLTITVRDVSRIGDVLTQALGAGSINISSLVFTVSDMSKLEAEAHEKAMADAKARAERLAAAAGVSLDRLMTIGEASRYEPQASPPTGQFQVVYQVSVTYALK